MKPIIGVLPLWDDKKESLWMLPGYFGAVTEAGAIPVMLPLTTDPQTIERLSDMCDGLLFTGGHDVSPEIYGAAPAANVVCCRERDDMETMLLKTALEKDQPILGICRGIQFINASLGGTLYQDIPTEHPSNVEHHQTPPYDIPVHRNTIKKSSPLYKVLGCESLPVNSYHHQAVKEVAPELEVMAVSEDGLVEALFMPSKKFVWAVQWHPEFSYKTDEASRRILKAFTDAAK